MKNPIPVKDKDGNSYTVYKEAFEDRESNIRILDCITETRASGLKKISYEVELEEYDLKPPNKKILKTYFWPSRSPLWKNVIF